MSKKTNAKLCAADLFCGGGGTSTGLLRAADELGLNVELAAVNHWETAIATHSLNHPDVRHFNSDLERLDPRTAIPGGRLRLLVASQECTHFSRARGGVPMSRQSRASAKYILKWIHQLDVDDVLIENVPEFRDWGPLHRKCSCGAGKDIKKRHAKGCLYGKPIVSRKGEFFIRFVHKLMEAGYLVAWRVLNSADYGDATTRKRLFIIARKRMPSVSFPDPSHGRIAQDMFRSRKPWRSAAKIIDWGVKGSSIFNRKRPLAENTLRRIFAGLEKYGGKPFVLSQQSGGAPRGLDKPIPTVTGAGNIQFVEPFLLQMDNGGKVRSLKVPMPTITSADAFALVEPYLVEYYGTGGACSIKEPLPTQTSRDRFALVQPAFEHDGKTYKMDILYRMLTPKELAKAMGFPKDYRFAGSREEVVKQIGNAVTVGLSYALCKHLLETRMERETAGRQTASLSTPTLEVRHV